VFLVAIDTFARETNPYVGILTYLVAPAFLILGLALGLGGWWVQRRQAARHPVDGGSRLLAIDLSRPNHRRYLTIFASGALLFLLLTAFGSYQTYHFTESVTFCGQTCHGVMQPEFHHLPPRFPRARVVRRLSHRLRRLVVREIEDQRHLSGLRHHVQQIRTADQDPDQEPPPGTRDLRALPLGRKSSRAISTAPTSTTSRTRPTPRTRYAFHCASAAASPAPGSSVASTGI